MTKRIVALLLALALLLPALALGESAPSLTDKEGNIVFPDAYWEQVLREALETPEGPVSRKDVGKMTQLTLRAPQSDTAEDTPEGEEPAPYTPDLRMLKLMGGLSYIELDHVAGKDWGRLTSQSRLSEACLVGLNEETYNALMEDLPTRLRTLTLRDMTLTTDMMKRLGRRRAIFILTLDNVTLENPEDIQMLTQVDTFSLKNMPDFSAPMLAKMKRLISLTISKPAEGIDLSAVEKLSSLKELRLVRCGDMDLSRLKKLKVLWIDGKKQKLGQ